MTRRELESKMAGLRADLRDVDSGVNSVRLLANYAPGYGLGYKAFATARQIIEAKIAEVEKGLASLPEESTLEEMKYAYEVYGSNYETDRYIKALEACRPWVIKSKSTGVFARRLVSGDISLYSTKEIADKDRKDTGRTHEWEVVQWEGSQ